ncbi:MAG: hypothetical protein E5V53_24995, partial [Mesorhizobium sp.]
MAGDWFQSIGLFVERSRSAAGLVRALALAKRRSPVQKPAMLIINDLTLRMAGRLLLDHASLTLPAGTKAGLV